MPHSLTFGDLQNIADVLAAGFEALLAQVHEQKRTEDTLRARLERAVEKYEQLNRSCNSSSGEFSDWRDEITKQISPAPVRQDASASSTASDTVRKAQEALQRLSMTKMVSPTRPKKCPVTLKVSDAEDFEHDFTTPGRIGDLGCPFAKLQNGDGECGPDPIAEEFHGEKASAMSKASAKSGSRCPIRYLDKHSPEEIAQYFENHKHEIPRSHEICVKRYRQNEDSIRELDAKYGNLVSMIQGLGNKHKQYLPEDEKAAGEQESDSTKAVEKWAENVSQQSAAAEETERVPHFERPLRDIRVGESPSRPWGISVPPGKSLAASASRSQNEAQPSIKPPSTVPAQTPGDIPLGQQPHLPTRERSVRSVQSPFQPQIVFSGPVFFGYPAEEAAMFLQKLGTGGGGMMQ